MPIFDKAVYSAPGQGQIVMAFGHHRMRFRSEDTGGRMACMDVTLPSGGGPPMHIHECEEEFFSVTSGRFGFWCGDDYIELEPGGVILLPRMVPHTFKNVGSGDGSILVTMTPGGFDGFFPAIEAMGPASFEDIAALAKQNFGLTFLGGPG